MSRANIDYTQIPLGANMTSWHFELDIPKDILSTKKLAKAMPQTLKRIAKDAKKFWDTEAGKMLRTSRVKYRESTSIQALDETTVLLVMEPFAGLIEGGRRRFDMKPGFLASNKATTRFRIPRAFASTLPKARIFPKSATKFIIIPLRWSQGGTTFRTVSDKSPAKSWIWSPRKGGTLDNKGLDIRDRVVTELQDNIIPMRMREMIEKVWSET